MKGKGFAFGLLVLLLSVPAFALEAYKLDMEVSLGNKLVSRPQLVVAKGKKAYVTKEDSATNLLTNISIVPDEGEIQGNKGILLNLEIEHRQGQVKNVVARPQVLVWEGKEAFFETSDNTGAEKLVLKIVATRTTLP